jgi:sirohydrochlorin ferrochelatase
VEIELFLTTNGPHLIYDFPQAFMLANQQNQTYNSDVVPMLGVVGGLCLWLQVLKEQLAQAAAARERSGSAEQAEYAKNVVVNYLETRDPSLLPALRQVIHVARAQCTSRTDSHTLM